MYVIALPASAIARQTREARVESILSIVVTKLPLCCRVSSSSGSTTHPRASRRTAFEPIRRCAGGDAMPLRRCRWLASVASVLRRGRHFWSARRWRCCMRPIVAVPTVSPSFRSWMVDGSTPARPLLPLLAATVRKLRPKNVPVTAALRLQRRRRAPSRTCIAARQSNLILGADGHSERRPPSASTTAPRKKTGSIKAPTDEGE